MSIVITGATGYIGRHLAKVAIGRGFDVVSLSKRQAKYHEDSWISYNLTDPSVPNLPPGTHTLIHLATNTDVAHDSDVEVELRSARLLLLAAKKAGAKFIFASSQTARADAPTSYGRNKWAIERQVLAAGGIVVRPGQVYGGEASGLFGYLVEFTRRSPLLPAFLPAPKIQPIHVDDLVEGILSIVSDSVSGPRVLNLATPTPIKFSEFMSAIARVRTRRRRLLVPVPVVFIGLISRIIGRRLRSLLGYPQLKSLLALPLVNTDSDLKLLNLTLRPLVSGLHLSGEDRRRRLIMEGVALLGYVLKERPDSDLLRRYVRAVEKLRVGSPLVLPAWVVKWPVLIGLFDSRFISHSAGKRELIWRLNAATALAEASPAGACRFLALGHGDQGRVRSVISLCYAITKEMIWSILELVCSPFLSRYMEEGGRLK